MVKLDVYEIKSEINNNIFDSFTNYEKNKIENLVKDLTRSYFTIINNINGLLIDKVTSLIISKGGIVDIIYASFGFGKSYKQFYISKLEDEYFLVEFIKSEKNSYGENLTEYYKCDQFDEVLNLISPTIKRHKKRDYERENIKKDTETKLKHINYKLKNMEYQNFIKFYNEFINESVNLINESNSLYKEIPGSDIDSYYEKKWLYPTDKEIEIVSPFFNNNYKIISDSDGSHCYFCNNIFYLKLKYKNLLSVAKLEDEWYLISIRGVAGSNKGIIYYICDQIEGLMNCLKNETIL